MPEPDLLARVRERRVVVIGGDACGLLAAVECARFGLPVTVLEPGEHLGGDFATIDLDGAPADPVAAPFTHPSDELDALLAAFDIAAVADPVSAVAVATGSGVFAVPEQTLLGIPVNAWAADVRRVIGGRGAWRAYLDRLRPPLTIGREASLGALVRRRLGHRVADLLVAPVVRGRLEGALDDLDADLALPGVSTALTRTGSLGGAIAQLFATDAAARLSVPGAALVDALVRRLDDLDADVRTGIDVRALARDGARWSIDLGDEAIAADAVIVSTDPASARALIAPVVPGLPGLTGEGMDVVEVVTLAVDGEAGPYAELAFTPDRSPALWAADITADAAAGVRIVRVALPASGEQPESHPEGVVPGADARDATPPAPALAAIELLLGRKPSGIRAWHSATRIASGIGRRQGDPERARAVRDAVRTVPGLHVVGPWPGGGDVGEALLDARAEAERARRALVWTADGEE